MNVIDIPEEELMKNPAYAQLRQEGWNDLDARLEMANTDAAGEGTGMPISAPAGQGGWTFREAAGPGRPALLLRGL